MSKFPDPIRPYWPKITGRRLELVVISEPTSWVSHWDVTIRRSRRCGGPGCSLCAAGYQKQLRVVLMCIDNQGRDALLELRERHREMLDGYESAVGLRISVRRAGQATNSPVDLQILGEENVQPRDIGALVRCMGLEPIVGRLDDGLQPARELVEKAAAVELDEGADVSERWT